VAMFTENKELLINKIPEINGFYKIHFGYEGKVFGGEQDRIFANSEGRLFLDCRLHHELLSILPPLPAV
jgi:hypothetical protein